MGGDAPQTPRLRVGSARAFCPVPFAPCLLPRAFCPVPFAPCLLPRAQYILPRAQDTLPRAASTNRTSLHPLNQGQGVWGLLCWRAAAPHLVHPIQRAVAAAFIQIFHLFRRSTNTSVAIGVG